jgi:hypothetical protein
VIFCIENARVNEKVGKVWGARYTLSARYLSKNTVYLSMERICFTYSDMACFQLFDARITSKKYLEIGLQLTLHSKQTLSP